MIFRGDSSTARAPGTHPETPVKIRRPAPTPVELRWNAFVAAGPRRLVTSVLTVTAGVFAAMGVLRLVADPPLRQDIQQALADVLLDHFTIVAALPSPLAMAAIGLALLVGVATLFLSRSQR